MKTDLAEERIGKKKRHWKQLDMALLMGNRPTGIQRSPVLPSSKNRQRMKDVEVMQALREKRRVEGLITVSPLSSRDPTRGIHGMKPQVAESVPQTSIARIALEDLRFALAVYGRQRHSMAFLPPFPLLPPFPPPFPFVSPFPVPSHFRPPVPFPSPYPFPVLVSLVPNPEDQSLPNSTECSEEGTTTDSGFGSAESSPPVSVWNSRSNSQSEESCPQHTEAVKDSTLSDYKVAIGGHRSSDKGLTQPLPRSRIQVARQRKVVQMQSSPAKVGSALHSVQHAELKSSHLNLSLVENGRKVFPSTKNEQENMRRWQKSKKRSIPALKFPLSRSGRNQSPSPNIDSNRRWETVNLTTGTVDSPTEKSPSSLDPDEPKMWDLELELDWQKCKAKTVPTLLK